VATEPFRSALRRVTRFPRRGLLKSRNYLRLSDGRFSVAYKRTTNHVEYFRVISPNNGYGSQTLRVLRPTKPAAAPHNFLYVLPVEPRLRDFYGDGLETVRALAAQNRYNLTVVEPSFAVDPWYANHPSDRNLQYETFLTEELRPWVASNLATSGSEQHWLLGFSKSGVGAQGLVLKHPDVFTLAASWDFPANIASYDEYGSSSAEEYGTDANFQANYRLTRSFLAAHKEAFRTRDRIWIAGYHTFRSDVSDYDALLTSVGIAHLTGASRLAADHRWDCEWMTEALAALAQMSAQQT
jgi:hypothetical protein